MKCKGCGKVYYSRIDCYNNHIAFCYAYKRVYELQSGSTRGIL